MLTFAFCTYNRADRLEKLVAAMRAQNCPIPFEILVVNNNSADNTVEVLTRLAQQTGPLLRWVTEPVQGIVPARNRAIEESLNSDILVFIDDDEIPLPGLLEAAVHAILNEGAQCAGGRVEIDFSQHQRPTWLDREIAGFLGSLDYGSDPLWIEDRSTPVWSGNIAYDMHLFRNDPNLRFDKRYNREGRGIGGGEDAIMFRTLLERKVRIRYCPGMAVLHAVEPWRLKRRYFLKLHYRAGLRQGLYELPNFSRTLFGVPPFLVSQLIGQCARTVAILLKGQEGTLRQAMNAAHAWGTLVGYSRHVR